VPVDAGTHASTHTNARMERGGGVGYSRAQLPLEGDSVGSIQKS